MIAFLKLSILIELCLELSLHLDQRVPQKLQPLGIEHTSLEQSQLVTYSMTLFEELRGRCKEQLSNIGVTRFAPAHDLVG